jgi:cell division initiation protein
MLSPQNIREKTFEKAVFGGYDMSSVDDFLENVAADFASLQKDNIL